MVEGGDQLCLFRGKQAVTEYVSRHITDTDGGELIQRRVDAQLAEMALHGHPGTTSGYAHFLVVIAVAATGGKGIPHPEAVLRRQTIGDVREGCSPLVRSHDQVMVILIVTDHRGWRLNTCVHQVVGNVQQATDEGLIGFDALSLESLAIRYFRKALGHETTLGTDWHDYRVLDLLGFDQPENLGAVVLETIGPAQTTSSHLATTQMHALNPW